jgi:aminopeptidase 2
MTLILRKLDHSLWNFNLSNSYREQGLKVVLFANAEDCPPGKAVSNDLFKRFMHGDHKALHPNIYKSVFSIVLSNPSSSPKGKPFPSLPSFPTYTQLTPTHSTPPSSTPPTTPPRSNPHRRPPRPQALPAPLLHPPNTIPIPKHRNPNQQ